MNPAVKIFVVPLAFLFFGVCANAADSVASKNEEKLVGAWQEGMSSRLAGANAEQLRRAEDAGLLGSVVQYNADHTFVLYPSCGTKKDEMRKVGVQSIKGTWELTEAGYLISKVEARGKSLTIDTKLTWKDGQMVLLNKNGSVAGKSGRYLGTLPPGC